MNKNVPRGLYVKNLDPRVGLLGGVVDLQEVGPPLWSLGPCSWKEWRNTFLFPPSSLFLGSKCDCFLRHELSTIAISHLYQRTSTWDFQPFQNLGLNKLLFFIKSTNSSISLWY